MRTEITTPTEAQMREAQRILSRIRYLHERQQAIQQEQKTLLARAAKILDVPIVKLR
jgi:hypothetical protein